MLDIMKNDRLPEKSEQISHKDRALISQIAHMYYNENMLQPEIADRLYFSRSKVSRLLKASRDLGIVEIQVHQSFDRTESVEEQLKSTFGLKDAVALTCFEGCDAPATFQAVSEYAGNYISSLIKGNLTIGITNGTTLGEVCRYLTKKENCFLNVIQLMGSVSNTYLHEESRQLVNRLLEIYPGIGHYISAPLYIDDPGVKEYLLKERSIAGVYKLMKRCQIILTGIGSLDTTEINKWYNYQEEHHYEEITRRRCVGSICAQYYEAFGRPIDCEWNRKCIAMPLEDFRKVPNVIGVGCGSTRVPAILGALRGGYIRTLVTDAETAASILDLERKTVRYSKK